MDSRPAIERDLCYQFEAECATQIHVQTNTNHPRKQRNPQIPQVNVSTSDVGSCHITRATGAKTGQDQQPGPKGRDRCLQAT